MKITEQIGSRSKIRWCAASAAALLLLAGCTTPLTPTADNQEGDKSLVDMESKYGIHVEGLHLSAHGYILDLRYRVLDPKKAALLLDSKKKVYLIDEAHRAKLGVPQSPVIGGMRQTSRNHVVYTDRSYFILFTNPGRAVLAGDTLKLAVDEVNIAELKVE